MTGSGAPEPEWQRRLACCDQDPRCHLCPLRPENADRTLKDLALASLKAPSG